MSASLTPAFSARSRVRAPWKPRSEKTSMAAARIWVRRSVAFSRSLGKYSGVSIGLPFGPRPPIRPAYKYVLTFYSGFGGSKHKPWMPGGSPLASWIARIDHLTPATGGAMLRKASAEWKGGLKDGQGP